MARPLTMAIDLGGTKIIACLFQSNGTAIQVCHLPTGHDFLHQLSILYRNFSDAHGWIETVSIGVPGPVAGNTMESSFPLNIREPIRFEACFPGATKVVVENDLFMALCAELREGVGRQCENFVLVSLSTGIGVGVVIDSRPLKIRCELGHQLIGYDQFSNDRPKAERWSDHCSGKAMEARKTQNVEYLRVLRNINTVAFANLILAYDPCRIVVMGGVAKNLWRDIVPDSNVIGEMLSRPVIAIAPTEIGSTIGVRGAFLYAQNI